MNPAISLHSPRINVSTTSFQRAANFSKITGSISSTSGAATSPLSPRGDVIGNRVSHISSQSDFGGNVRSPYVAAAQRMRPRMVASRTQGKPKILETIAGTEYHETNNNASSNLKPTQKSTNVNGNSLETSESSPEKQRPNQTGAVSAETSLKEAQCTSKKSLRPDSDHFKSYLKAYREGRAKLNAENRQEGNAMARLAQHVELDPSARRKDHRSSPVRRASASVSTTPTTKRNEVSTSAAFASSSPRPTLAASVRRAPARLEAWGGEGAAASGSARPGTPEEYFSSAQTRLHRSDDQADDSFRAARRPSAPLI